MLHADLFFYPDARKAARFRIGSLLATETEEQLLVSFYEKRAAILDSMSLIDSQVLRSTLEDVRGFLGRIVENLEPKFATSPAEVLAGLASHLPYNLKISDPAPWPPEKFLMEASREGAIIESSAVHTRVAVPA